MENHKTPDAKTTRLRLSGAVIGDAKKVGLESALIAHHKAGEPVGRATREVAPGQWETSPLYLSDLKVTELGGAVTLSLQLKPTPPASRLVSVTVVSASLEPDNVLRLSVKTELTAENFPLFRKLRTADQLTASGYALPALINFMTIVGEAGRPPYVLLNLTLPLTNQEAANLARRFSSAIGSACGPVVGALTLELPA